VSRNLVGHWRRALGVPRDNTGTQRVLSYATSKLTKVSKSRELRRRMSAFAKRRRKRGEFGRKDERPYTPKEIALLGTDSLPTWKGT
jgi:hypothetical protein